MVELGVRKSTQSLRAPGLGGTVGERKQGKQEAVLMSLLNCEVARAHCCQKIMT
jgi:hypothetical protein